MKNYLKTNRLTTKQFDVIFKVTQQIETACRQAAKIGIDLPDGMWAVASENESDQDTKNGMVPIRYFRIMTNHKELWGKQYEDPARHCWIYEETLDDDL
jgi:hypothetical protein